MSTLILLTTIRRHTPYTEPSGYIYTYDLENKKVVQRSIMVEPAFREADTNPRGGIRGGRGISIRSQTSGGQDQIAIANASMILRYDPQWNLLGMLSHPSCNAIHDILFDAQGESLWLTSARNDLLCQFDLNGKMLRHYYLRDRSPALDALQWKPPVLLKSEAIRQGKIDFRDPRTHEEETYDRTHLNSLCLLPDGGMLVSLGLVLGGQFAGLLRIKSRLVKAGVWPALLSANRKLRSTLGLRKNMHSDLVVQPARARSAVVQISPDGAHRLVLALPDATVPSHSLLALSAEQAVYLNTTQGEIVHFSLPGGDVLSSTRVTDGFLRGVIRLPDGKLLMGSRGELIVFDLSRLEVIDRLRLTEDANESVYDLKILPEHYSLPPQSFEQHFIDTVGVKADDLLRSGQPLPLLSPTSTLSSTSLSEGKAP